MKTSEKVAAITVDLIKAHADINHAIKDAKNPHFKNDYATLESVIDASKQVLLRNNIVVLQSLSDKSLTTRLQHASGEFFESEITLLVDKNNMQGMGSAITYARRYSLAAILNMSQADDDGNEATKNPPQKSVATPAVENTNLKKEKYDPAEYVFDFGPNSKMTGKKMKEYEPDFLVKFIEDKKAWYRKENKAIHPNVIASDNAIKDYIEKLSLHNVHPS